MSKKIKIDTVALYRSKDSKKVQIVQVKGELVDEIILLTGKENPWVETIFVNNPKAIGTLTLHKGSARYIGEKIISYRINPDGILSNFFMFTEVNTDKSEIVIPEEEIKRCGFSIIANSDIDYPSLVEVYGTDGFYYGVWKCERQGIGSILYIPTVRTCSYLEEVFGVDIDHSKLKGNLYDLYIRAEVLNVVSFHGKETKENINLLVASTNLQQDLEDENVDYFFFNPEHLNKDLAASALFKDYSITSEHVEMRVNGYLLGDYQIQYDNDGYHVYKIASTRFKYESALKFALKEIDIFNTYYVKGNTTKSDNNENEFKPDPVPNIIEFYLDEL